MMRMEGFGLVADRRRLTDRVFGTKRSSFSVAVTDIVRGTGIFNLHGG